LKISGTNFTLLDSFQTTPLKDVQILELATSIQTQLAPITLLATTLVTVAQTLKRSTSTQMQL
jgi:hypothetical protein